MRYLGFSRVIILVFRNSHSSWILLNQYFLVFSTFYITKTKIWLNCSRNYNFLDWVDYILQLYLSWKKLFLIYSRLDWVFSQCRTFFCRKHMKFSIRIYYVLLNQIFESFGPICRVKVCFQCQLIFFFTSVLSWSFSDVHVVLVSLMADQLSGQFLIDQFLKKTGQKIQESGQNKIDLSDRSIFFGQPKKMRNWPDNWSAMRLTKTTWTSLIYDVLPTSNSYHKSQKSFTTKGHSFCKQCLQDLQFMKTSPPHQTFPS